MHPLLLVNFRHRPSVDLKIEFMEICIGLEVNKHKIVTAVILSHFMLDFNIQQ